MRSGQILLVLVLAAVAVYALIQLKLVVIPLLIAVIIAAALSPLIVAGEDDVRIHPHCTACDGRTVLLGRAHDVEPAAGYRVL